MALKSLLGSVQMGHQQLIRKVVFKRLILSVKLSMIIGAVQNYAIRRLRKMVWQASDNTNARPPKNKLTAID